MAAAAKGEMRKKAILKDATRATCDCTSGQPALRGDIEDRTPAAGADCNITGAFADKSNQEFRRGDGIGMSAWIRMITPEEATGRLAELYERVKTPHGTVDNVMRAHSLRPESLEGHVVLYRSVLHNEANTLPFWFLEAVATCVSLTNRCHYSTTHHSANMRRLVEDESRGEAMYAALACGHPEVAFDGKELALLEYARKLTAEVGAMCEEDVEHLREAGADDGEILEVNQVCAYFNYSNRLLNGLGVTTRGDVVGYYKRTDAGD